MQRLFPHPWGWATLAPIACAIHCLAAPVAVALSPALAVGKTAEWALLGLTVALVAWAIPAGLRRHGNWGPVALVGAGLALWVVSLLHLIHAVPEELTTVLGSVTVAVGLFLNARLHCEAPEAACSACEHGEAEAAPVPIAPASAPPARAGHAERYEAA